MSGWTRALHRSWLVAGVLVLSAALMPATAHGQAGTPRGGSVSPSGFEQTGPVAIAGLPVVGEVLSVFPGQWSPTPVSTTVTWYADARRVGVGTTYRVQVSDLGATLSATVEVSDGAGTTATATSSRRGPVVAPVTITSRAVVSGEIQVGQVLTVVLPTYTGEVVETRIDWCLLFEGRDTCGLGSGLTWTVPGGTEGGRPWVQVTLVDAFGRPHVSTSGDVDAVIPVRPGTMTMKAAPRITGEAVVGRTLELRTGDWNPVFPTFDVTWLRDGVPVPGEKNRSYRVRTADVGARISARIVVSKRGYSDFTATTRPTAVTRAVSRISVRSRVRGRTVTLKVSVSAAGLTSLTGKVRVKLGRRTLRTLTLKKGNVTVVLPKQARGRKQYVLSYLGSSTSTSATTTVTVRVR